MIRERSIAPRVHAALSIINTDTTTLLPIRYASDMKATKREIYYQVFGEEARFGFRKERNGEIVNTLGYYRRYNALTRAEIDAILDEQVIQLASATVGIYVPLLVETALSNAQFEAEKRQHDGVIRRQ